MLNNFNAETLRNNCKEANDKKIAYAYSLVDKWSEKMIEESKRGCSYYPLPHVFCLTSFDSDIIDYITTNTMIDIDYNFPYGEIKLSFYTDYFEALGFTVKRSPQSNDKAVTVKIYW